MGKKKILIIDNSLYPTGALRSILNVIALLNTDYSFCFAISSQSRNGRMLEDLGYTVYRIPFLEISKSPRSLALYLPKLLANTRRLRQIIQKEQIAIVHVNDLFNQLGTMLKLFSRRTPVVYHIRLLASSYIGQLFGLFASLIKRLADRIICVSDPVLQDVGATPKAEIIYDGMEAKEAFPPWNGLNNASRAHILYLGNIVRGKGQQWGLLAFAEAAKAYPEITLEYSGGVNSQADETFRQELQTMAAANGIADRVSFTGPTTSVEQKMKAADVVLNMSESESFSMVCLEAMMYGVPLIASDCGGPRDITDNGRMAALVPNKSAGEAAGAILHILRQPEAAKQKAADAKSYAGRKYSLAKSADRLRTLYESLLEDRGSQKGNKEGS